LIFCTISYCFLLSKYWLSLLHCGTAYQPVTPSGSWLAYNPLAELTEHIFKVMEWNNRQYYGRLYHARSLSVTIFMVNIIISCFFYIIQYRNSITKSLPQELHWKLAFLWQQKGGVFESLGVHWVKILLWTYIPANCNHISQYILVITIMIQFTSSVTNIVSRFVSETYCSTTSLPKLQRNEMTKSCFIRKLGIIFTQTFPIRSHDITEHNTKS